jgi:2-amino-4-hydroxy-6-hydroxymethyldihydropteridine diphosphokinase
VSDPVLLGLGANLGDPAAQLARAVELLRAHVDVRRVSSLYRSAAEGYAEQPDFLNLVVAGRTELDARALLAAAQGVERALGRERSFPNAPRTLDVDLLAHGDRVLASPGLVLPHPRLHLRGFVLHPLVEVAPDWRHPVLERTARELLASARSLGRVERLGPLPGTPPPLAPGSPRG